MKKNLLLTLVALLCVVHTQAYDFEKEGIYYTITSETTVEVVAKEKYSGTIIIPAEVHNYGITYSVTSIGSSAFYDCTGLTSITIPNSVTNIGGDAFFGCTGLTSVTIPNSVTSIGDYAFSYVPNIVYYGTATGSPWGARSINGYVDGYLVYEDDTKTKLLVCFTTATGELVIPNSVTWIGSRAFSSCTGLTSITIPNSVTWIGSWAFSGCTGLTSVTIPNSVTSIRRGAFSGCTGLTFVTIPNSVTNIGGDAFDNTPWYNNQPDGVVYINNLLYKYKGTMPVNTPIAVQEGTVSINPYAFSGCTGLTSITIPNSVTNIGGDALFGCTGLTSITIPNSVTSIEYRAFSYCTGLTSITIPNSVTNIGGDAFKGTPWLENQSGLIYIGNVLYAYRGKMPENTSIVVKDGITSIGDNAFSGCTGLTSIIIPNSVTSIGAWAFSDCTGLTSITIPNSVTNIEDYAFRGCTGLTSVTIPNSVTSIGWAAFYNVPNIVYYGTATGSPWGARSMNGYVDGYLVYEDDTRAKLLACSSAATDKIVIPNSVISIGDNAFSGCKGLTSVTIPNSVTSIGERVFFGCTGFISIIVESGNMVYDSRNNCNALIETATNTLIQGCNTTIIPNNITSIGEFAFRGCTGLTSITIPNSVTSIGWAAFSNVPNIVYYGTATGSPWGARSMNGYVDGYLVYEDDTRAKLLACSSAATDKIVIPNSVISIGDNAFSGCTGLTSITIPNSVTWIGSQAFSSCTGLTSITIPNSVTSIGGSAFFGCTALTSVTSLAPIPPTTRKDAFWYVLTDIPVYVPCGSKDAYSTAEEWRSFNNYIEQQTAIVTITSQDENKGMVTITKRPSCEDNICTFVATPKEDYRFVQWSDGNTDNPRTIIVTEDITLTAEFEDTSVTNVLQTTDNQFVIPQKIIRNGQVYILRNDKTYTTTGVEIK